MNDSSEASGFARARVWVEQHSMLTMVGLIMVVGLVVASIANADGDDTPEFGDQYGAIDACHQAVKEKLKSPSTAKFSSDRADLQEDERWTVTGAVDSENSFGAMIRGTYSCQARYDGDDSYLVNGVRIE